MLPTLANRPLKKVFHLVGVGLFFLPFSSCLLIESALYDPEDCLRCEVLWHGAHVEWSDHACECGFSRLEKECEEEAARLNETYNTDIYECSCTRYTEGQDDW